MIDSICKICNYPDYMHLKSSVINMEKIKMEHIKKDVNQLHKQKTCESCGTSFEYTSQYKKYCSSKCYPSNLILKNEESHKQRIQTLKANKLNKFYELYNYDFDNFGGNRIWCLIRDKFKCQKCGVSNNLNVHHIDGKGFAVAPMNRNNDIHNLTTLCNKCHDNIEKENIKIEDYVNKGKLRQLYSLKTKN